MFHHSQVAEQSSRISFFLKNKPASVVAVFLYINVADTFVPLFTRIGHHCEQFFPLHVVIESNRVCA